MDASMPFLKEQMRQLIRGFSGSRVCGSAAGARRASSSRRACGSASCSRTSRNWPTSAVEEGAIPVLHFDADWTRDLERFKEFPKAKCVLSLDGKTDIFKAKEVLGDHMCLMGDVPARHALPGHASKR